MRHVGERHPTDPRILPSCLAVRRVLATGRFVGLDIYLDRGHLAIGEISAAWTGSQTTGEFLDKLGNLPLYRALAFTAVFVAVVTPLTIVLGLMIALAVNTLSEKLKGF
ncbi:MAG: hypothetical protein AAGE94_08075, partial [Acidobacteriota bacterium]